jgi:PKD repeat protein
MFANPDTLSFDGASQSQITVEARDANGQPAPNVVMRAQILANDTLVDFGTLSARTIVTSGNGRATLVYTAPTPVAGPIPSLAIMFTPTGTDAANSVGRTIGLRLVPPGTISAGGPTPSFTFSPASPVAFTDVFFDASSSTASLGTAISGYSWNFGDGSSATGVQPSHRFNSSGSYHVTLSVTDSNGVTSSISKDVGVGSGTASTANFTFSPTAPITNQEINFNASTSTAGGGHRLVRYDWNFGSGSSQSGVTVSKTYDVAGIYNVTLTTTDEVGQTAQVVKAVTVTAAPGGGSLTAAFTKSPTDPHNGDVVNFNASTSTAAAGTTITNYAWDFGDGSTSAVNAGATTQHTFTVTISHTFTVTLTVTDSLGRTATTVNTIQVAFP